MVIRRDKLKKKLDNYDVLPISYAYEGVLPGKATVKVTLDSNWLKSKDKDNIYVYHYSPDTDKAELIGKGLKVDENGYLSFNITHCSDYFLSDKDLVEAGILPKTGSVLDNNILMFVGSVLLLVGFCLIVRRKVNKTS